MRRLAFLYLLLAGAATTAHSAVIHTYTANIDGTNDFIDISIPAGKVCTLLSANTTRGNFQQITGVIAALRKSDGNWFILGTAASYQSPVIAGPNELRFLQRQTPWNGQGEPPASDEQLYVTVEIKTPLAVHETLTANIGETANQYAVKSIPAGTVASVVYSTAQIIGNDYSPWPTGMDIKGNGSEWYFAQAISDDVDYGLVVLAGPRSARFYNATDLQKEMVITIKLQPQPQDSSEVLSVPAGSPGTVLFEQSSNLYDWTTAVSTNISAATPHRFFRLRAVTD